MKNVSNSDGDPYEIERKGKSSYLDFRAAPSSIFPGIEMADLRIC
jgi:hypothetical protein